VSSNTATSDLLTLVYKARTQVRKTFDKYLNDQFSEIRMYEEAKRAVNKTIVLPDWLSVRACGLLSHCGQDLLRSPEGTAR
jgi:hypothetical protein